MITLKSSLNNYDGSYGVLIDTYGDRLQSLSLHNKVRLIQELVQHVADYAENRDDDSYTRPKCVVFGFEGDQAAVVLFDEFVPLATALLNQIQEGIYRHPEDE